MPEEKSRTGNDSTHTQEPAAPAGELPRECAEKAVERAVEELENAVSLFMQALVAARRTKKSSAAKRPGK